MKTLAIALLLGLAGCGRPATQPPTVRAADFPDDMPACIGDDDCLISTFAGCCACPEAGRVRARVELAMAQAPCTAVECARAQGACGPPPPTKYRRVACERGHCVGKR